MLLLMTLIAAPVLWVAGYSLLYSLGAVGRFRCGWTTAHWIQAFSSLQIGVSLLYSATISVVVVGLGTIVSLGLSVLLIGHRHQRRVIFALSVPMATPVAVTAMMVYQVFNPGGLLARIAYWFGWIQSSSEFPVLVNDAWSIGIVVAGLFSIVPLLTVFFLRTWTSAKIDRFVYVAAGLGAKRWQSLLRIAVPMLMRRSRSMLLLLLLIQFGSFEVPLLLGRQSPQMISVLTQRRFGQYDLMHRPEAFVVSSTCMVVVGAGVILLQKLRQNDER